MSAADQLKDAMDQPAELPFSEDDLASRFSTEHVDTTVCASAVIAAS